MIAVEEKFMTRCLALARNGTGKVTPNPMVGCVLVHNGRIIGEGYHRKYGEAHAEVNAIASVADASLLSASTLYVNLEPCSHQGKTPPCAELIIRKRIPRVVIACPDPYPKVSGRGIRMLQEAGVEVITGVLEKESFALNKAFMTSHLLKRPYVSLKWAQSADGYMDRTRADVSVPPTVLSSPEILQQVHKKRAESAAIMVGTRTALLDNPSLTVRHWAGTSPVRVVLDRNLVIPAHYHVLDGKVRTLVFTSLEKEDEKNTEYIQTDFTRDVLHQVLSYLYTNKLTSLLVEGGAYLLKSFLRENVWDEICVETTSAYLGNGVAAPVLEHSYSPILEDVSLFSDNYSQKHTLSVYSRENTLHE